MVKLLKQALFVIPIAAIVAAPFILKDKVSFNFGAEKVADQSTKNTQNPHAGFSSYNPFSFMQKSSVPAAEGGNKYSMMEPFANGGMNAISYAMKKSMDPNTWMSIMMGMMSPHQTSPIVMCAKCHDEEDVARYQQGFGPMMQSMWSPYQSMMSPMMAYPTQMMMPMTGMSSLMGIPGANMSNTAPKVMNPEQYEKWYSEQRKKPKQNQ